MPTGIAVQVPLEVGSAQDMQVPVHAVLQQTPWAQWPVPQSESVVQVAPAVFFAQLPPTQK